VNYADDFVILTRGHAQEAQQAARKILTALKLTLNESKTRIVNAYQESFDFLGYSFGKLYGRNGLEYLGCAPSERSVEKHRRKLCELTESDRTVQSAEHVAAALHRATAGFWNYFCLGTTGKLCRDLDEYLRERMETWAKRKYQRPRRKKKASTPGTAGYWAKIKAATGLLKLGRDLRQKRNGPLFAKAASYAQ